MGRGIDHIVHAVRDLDAAGEFYRRLGFVVGARNRHPWGTHNRLVQFPGSFIELLTFAEADKLGDDGFSTLFGAYNRDFLARGEGLSLLILESVDIERDAQALAQAGIAASGIMRFEREGRRPGGQKVTVAFSLVFARDPLANAIRFAVCQQHFPDNFWNPTFQAHVNSAQGIKSVVMVAENPTDHHVFLSAFVDERELSASSTGITVATPRGSIQVMDPTAFRSHFGVDAPDVSAGPRLAALTFAVRDLRRVETALKTEEIPGADHMGRIVVGPAAAHGATLVFESP